MNKVNLALLVAIVAFSAQSFYQHKQKTAALIEAAEVNRLVAEETRELTEAIHANNRLLELIEGIE